MTEAEERLWSRFRNRRLGGFKFRRQHVFGCLRPDFICFAAGLIVEVDGSQHIEQATRDAHRTNLLQHSGYRVLRVWNNDVLSRIDAVLEAILVALAAPHPGRSAACPSPAARERAR
jgi:very-short-patch-repair endonuclease